MSVSTRILTKLKDLADLKTYHVGVIESAAHRALRQHKDTLLRNYGISGVEWYLIGIVADAGKQGIRATDLADILGTTAGFLTKTVKLLEAKGILQRTANADDARSSYIVLKPSYRKTFEEIEASLREKLRNSLYQLVTREELETYLRVMDKFRQLG